MLHISDCFICTDAKILKQNSLIQDLKVTGTYKYYQISHSAGVPYTVELQWFENLLNHENMFKTGVVRAINHSGRSGGVVGIFFRFSLT